MAEPIPEEEYEVTWVDSGGNENVVLFPSSVPFAEAQGIIQGMVEKDRQRSPQPFRGETPAEDDTVLTFEDMGVEPPVAVVRPEDVPVGTELRPILDPVRDEVVPLPAHLQERSRELDEIKTYTDLHSVQLARFWWDKIKDNPDGVFSKDHSWIHERVIPSSPKLGIRVIGEGDPAGGPMTEPFYFPAKAAGIMPGADRRGRMAAGELDFPQFYQQLRNSPHFMNYQQMVRKQVVDKLKRKEQTARGGFSGRMGTFFGALPGMGMQALAIRDDLLTGLKEAANRIPVNPNSQVGRELKRFGLSGFGDAFEAVAKATPGVQIQGLIRDQLVSLKENIEQSYGLTVDHHHPLSEVGQRLDDIKRRFPLLPDQTAEDMARIGTEFGVSQLVKFAADNNEIQKQRAARFEPRAVSIVRDKIEKLEAKILKTAPDSKRRRDLEKDMDKLQGKLGEELSGIGLEQLARVPAAFTLNAMGDGVDVVTGFLELGKLLPLLTPVSIQARRDLEQKYGRIGDDPMMNFYVGALSAAKEKGMLVDAPFGFLMSFMDAPGRTYATQPLSTLLTIYPAVRSAAKSGNAYAIAKEAQLRSLLENLKLMKERRTDLGSLPPELTRAAQKILDDVGITPEEYQSFGDVLDEAIANVESTSTMDVILGEKHKTRKALSYMMNKETFSALTEPIGATEGVTRLRPDMPLVRGGVKAAAALAPVAMMGLDPVVMATVGSGLGGPSLAPVALGMTVTPKWAQRQAQAGTQKNAAAAMVNQAHSLGIRMFGDVGGIAEHAAADPAAVRQLVDNFHHMEDYQQGLGTFVKDRIAGDSLTRPEFVNESMTFGQVMMLAEEAAGTAEGTAAGLKDLRARAESLNLEMEHLERLSPEEFNAFAEESGLTPDEVRQKMQAQLDAFQLDALEMATDTLHRTMGDANGVLFPETYGPVSAMNQQVHFWRRADQRLNKQQEAILEKFEAEGARLIEETRQKVEKGPSKAQVKARKGKFKETPDYKAWNKESSAARKERGKARGALTRFEKSSTKKIKALEDKLNDPKADLTPEAQLELAKDLQEARRVREDKINELKMGVIEAEAGVGALDATRDRMLNDYLDPEAFTRNAEEALDASLAKLQEETQAALGELEGHRGVLEARLADNLESIGAAARQDRAANQATAWGNLADVSLPTDTRLYAGHKTTVVTPDGQGGLDTVGSPDKKPMALSDREALYRESGRAVRSRILQGNAFEIYSVLARMAARRVASEGLVGLPLDLLPFDPTLTPEQAFAQRGRAAGAAGGGGALASLYTQVYLDVLYNDFSQLLLRSPDLKSRFASYLDDLTTDAVGIEAIERIVNEFASPRVEDASGIFYWTDVEFGSPVDPSLRARSPSSGLEGKSLSELFGDFINQLPEDGRIGFDKIATFNVNPGIARLLGVQTKQSILRRARLEAWDRLMLEAKVSAQSQGTMGFIAGYANSLPNLMFQNGFVDGAAGRSPSRYIANQVFDMAKNDRNQPMLIHGKVDRHRRLIENIKSGYDYVRNPDFLEAAQEAVKRDRQELSRARKVLQDLEKRKGKAADDARAGAQEAHQAARDALASSMLELRSIERNTGRYQNYIQKMAEVWEQQGGEGAAPFDANYWSTAALDSYLSSFDTNVPGNAGYVSITNMPTRMKSDRGANAEAQIESGAGLARVKIPIQFEDVPGFNEMFEAMGVNPAEVFVRRDFGGAAGTPLFWLTFNQAISQYGGLVDLPRRAAGGVKGWFTGKNPGSISTQWISNPLTEAAYTGDLLPVAAGKVLKTALGEYPSWAKDPSSVPPDIAFAFEQAVEANLLNLDFYTQEVLVQMESLADVPGGRAAREVLNSVRKRHGLKEIADMGEFLWNWKSRVERGLQRAFQTSDQSHRLHRFKESHVTMTSYERMSQPGSSVFYTDVRHNRTLGSATKQADGTWHVRTPDGKVHKGRNAAEKMNEMRRNAARDHANSLYVDFRDKVGIQHILGAGGAFVFGSFPTWRYAALDIPGVKRGLFANTFAPRSYFFSTDPAVLRRIYADSNARSIRQAYQATIGLTGDPDRESFREMVSDWNKSGAIFMHGSEGHFIKGESFIYYSVLLNLLKDTSELATAVTHSMSKGDLKVQRAAERKLGIKPPEYTIPLARELGLGEGILGATVRDILDAKEVSRDEGTLAAFSRAIVKKGMPQYAGRALRAIGTASLGVERTGKSPALEWMLDTVLPHAEYLTDYKIKADRPYQERVEAAAAMAALAVNNRFGSLSLQQRIDILRGIMNESDEAIERRIEEKFRKDTEFFGETIPGEAQRRLDENIKFEIDVRNLVIDQASMVDFDAIDRALKARRKSASEDWDDLIPGGVK